MNTIDKLIINSPYGEPTQYWSYDGKTRSFSPKEGRRPAGYVVASGEFMTRGIIPPFQGLDCLEWHVGMGRCPMPEIPDPFRVGRFKPRRGAITKVGTKFRPDTRQQEKP